MVENVLHCLSYLSRGGKQELTRCSENTKNRKVVVVAVVVVVLGGDDLDG